jgi:hypothetical protein
MNDELKITHEQLRLATSRTLPSNASLDSETTAVRDGFLSLGAAVESAAGNFDEAALLARLQKSCVATVVPPQRQEWPREWMTLILTGALAAAGLIVMARIATESQPTGPQVAQAENSAPMRTVSPPETMSNRSMFAWNDPLDDEIALASATIEQFTGRSRGFDDSLLDMNDQLRALSQELTNETL